MYVYVCWYAMVALLPPSSSPLEQIYSPRKIFMQIYVSYFCLLRKVEPFVRANLIKIDLILQLILDNCIFCTPETLLAALDNLFMSTLLQCSYTLVSAVLSDFWQSKELSMTHKNFNWLVMIGPLSSALIFWYLSFFSSYVAPLKPELASIRDCPIFGIIWLVLH